jgi:hypothetical protein
MNSYARFPDVMLMRKLRSGKRNFPAGLPTFERRRVEEAGKMRPFKSLLPLLRNQSCAAHVERFIFCTNQ